jgi:predicted DNA-binding protein
MNLQDYNQTVEGGKITAFQIDKATDKRIMNLCKKTGMKKSSVMRILIRMSLATVENKTI